MEANRDNQTRVQCTDQQSLGDPALGSGRGWREREKEESDTILIQLKIYFFKKIKAKIVLTYANRKYSPKHPNTFNINASYNNTERVI